ncbi:DNA mismatch repair protein MutS [Thioclava dalianensis]|uniref:DNA mismatch repair protein MutS n=1 Tax=Thioclava dalianensis TaxID=1185766 RepID=A0A074TF93_9RHOB|nr:Smr/MutS family protein [Thioclava dalianensis]KEP70334.1 DNA mismatch repair protein MutS [Thioclava dalianensis]SFN33203.1 DNA-nicking endonuclease, Smr domain [Thioclava dalianensis]
MSRRRKLTPEERELWSRVAASTRPTHPERPKLPATEPESPKKPAKTMQQELRAFRLGQSAKSPPPPHDLTPAPGEHLARQPVTMDRKAHKAMTRGKMTPEATLDLHGMTLAEAQPELIRFILNAQSHGRRLVLVITGKGKRGDDDGPIPRRIGVLRHQVPHWLRMMPLAPAVMQVTEAHLKHGGGGAYYVYLRRLR